MPDRSLATKQLATLLGVFSHPHRVRIVEELRSNEKDVNTLQDALGISHSGVSQHLAVLRSNNVVIERRVGRHVFYRLVDPRVSQWLLDGLKFLENAADSYDELRHSVRSVREQWTTEAERNRLENGGIRENPYQP